MDTTERRNWTLGAISALIILLLVTACVQSESETGSPVMGRFSRNREGYADITADQLAELMNSDAAFTLVNVHIPYEGEIPETDLFIPFDEIADHLEELPAQDAPIVLYCRSGSMSTTAAQELTELGYTNVAELDGGFRAWEAAGYELLNR